MIATLRQHSHLHRANMLDWLRHCEETGEPVPTDEAIADRFCYRSTEDARVLLADLADRGEIRIVRKGAAREIVVAPGKARHRLETTKPIPSVKRVEAPREMLSEDEGVSRIMDIINRPKLSRKVEAAAPALEGATRKEPNPGAPPQPAPVASAPASGPGRPPKTGPSAPGRSFTIIPSASATAVLDESAREQGKPAGRVMRDVIEAWAADVPLERKPTVPAAALLAAIREGVGLHQFVGTLIGLGLAAWERGER